MPQFQRPSVHKAVPISSRLMTHTEDVKTVSIISVGFQKLYIGAEKKVKPIFYLFFAVFYSLVVIAKAAYQLNLEKMLSLTALPV